MEMLDEETGVIWVGLPLGDEPVQLRSGAEAEIASLDTQSLTAGDCSFDESWA